LFFPSPHWCQAAEIVVEPVASGLSNPVAITHAGDGSGRLFVTLQAGQVLVWDGSQLLSPPFLDISSLVLSGGERGLLSVAFHHEYETNGFFFVNYTRVPDGATVVSRYTVSADSNLADANSAFILLTIPQPFANHNGGQLQFGPDGYLYIGMGDGGSGGDPQNNAQNQDSLLGKMLRIDVDGAAPYSVPPDNPFVGNPAALDEIWATGLRNPWRFGFDRLTGDLFIADVGQSDREEVNLEPAGDPGGRNYGWRLMEGTLCFAPPANCDDGSLTLPILEYDHSLGASVTGGFRYRGTLNLGLEGIYFYADFGSGRIWGAVQDGAGNWTSTELLDTGFSISTFGEDEEGELYFAHYNPVDGAVLRITEVQPNPPPPATSSSDGGGGGGCFIAISGS